MSEKSHFMTFANEVHTLLAKWAEHDELPNSQKGKSVKDKDSYLDELLNPALIEPCLTHFIEKNSHIKKIYTPRDKNKFSFILDKLLESELDKRRFASLLRDRSDLLNSFAAIDRFFQSYADALSQILIESNEAVDEYKSEKEALLYMSGFIAGEASMNFLARELFPLIYFQFIHSESNHSFEKGSFINGLRSIYKSHAFSGKEEKKIACPFGRSAGGFFATNLSRGTDGTIRVEPEKRAGALFMFVLNDVRATLGGQPLPVTPHYVDPARKLAR